MSPARVFDPPPLRAERLQLAQIVSRSISRQPFRRSDGRIVTDYVQGHLLLGDPDGLRLASQLVLRAVRDTKAEAVAGEVSAACALVSGTVAISSESGRALLGRYVRREERAYGNPGRLSAPLPEHTEVFLVDDVAATGASGIRCVDVLRSLGHKVTAMMVVVDRDQGAAERLAEMGVELWTLFSLDEVRGVSSLWTQAASS